jgi:fatty-acyl-CoA synthase
LPGLCCEAKVVDDLGVELAPERSGEIVVRGPNVFSGYWRNEKATRDVLRDGWFRTGDIGSVDCDGYFYVHDRKKNIIISGGENISAAEVERALLEHPDIVDCGVIGRPDSRWNEVPVAYVVVRGGCAISAEALQAHMLARLARFKVPRDFVFVDDLPRTALGKVQHFKLKALAGEGQ